MRILLHIGVWKTGSSAIQVSLVRHAAAMAAHGVHLPAHALAPNGYHALANAIRHGDGALLARCVEDIGDALRRAGRDGVVVVSSEHFWTLRPRQVERLAAALKATGAPVEVVAYLRPQDALWNSVYGQCARGLQVLAHHPRWGRGYAGAGLEAGFDFDRVFRLHARLFGRANIRLRPYRREAFPGGDVVADFLDVALPGQGGAIAPPPDEIHASFGWKGVAFAVARAQLLRQGGAFRPTPAVMEAHRRALDQTVRLMEAEGAHGWYGRGPAIFTERERREIRGFYAEGNVLLRRRHRLADDFFGPVSTAPRDPLRAPAIPAAERETALGLFQERLAASLRPETASAAA
ncbi:MAG: hypothetical protein AAFZ09_00640 [Pseudomonadota bacterium]